MKRILASTLFLLIGGIYYGQILQSIGFKSGVSNAYQTWYFDSPTFTIEKYSILGSYGVVSADFIESKYVHLTTDLGYCQKGWKEKIEIFTIDNPEVSTGVYSIYNTRFNYLTFCPSLKLKYPTKHFIPYLLLGARVDYQLSYASDIVLKEVENDFIKTILGFNAGAGMEFKLKNFGITSECQYLHDFTDLINRAPTGNSSGLRINTKALVVSIGLKYYLHKDKSAE